MTDLLLKNVRPFGGPPTDIVIRKGRIVSFGNCENHAAPVEDGRGAIVLPGLVEAHAHLDKSLWGMGWHAHQAGDCIEDRIANERRLRRDLAIDPARQAARQIALASAHGTTAIRSHVDIDTDQGLEGFEGVLAARERFRDVMDIEIVAFPQSGLMVRPGTVELLETALANGADVVGGLDPCAFDRDPKGQLDAVFGLADKYAKPIDIHLHELDELGAFTTELIIERTHALGMRGKVTISHAFCLGMADRSRAGGLIDKLAREDIAIATTAPASCAAPPVGELRAAGVRLCAGSDGIRDCWSPYGNLDMLERAMLIGLRYYFRRDDEIEFAFHICSQGGADVLDLPDYGLRPGAFADLVLVDAETVTEAVVAHPARKLVLKRGKPVARDGKALFSVE